MPHTYFIGVILWSCSILNTSRLRICSTWIFATIAAYQSTQHFLAQDFNIRGIAFHASIFSDGWIFWWNVIRFYGELPPLGEQISISMLVAQQVFLMIYFRNHSYMNKFMEKLLCSTLFGGFSGSQIILFVDFEIPYE